MSARTLDEAAFALTRVVASLDDDPYGESGDVLLSVRDADLLREVHADLHEIRRRGGSSAARPLREVASAHVEAVLQACAGNRTRAARILGVSPSTLYRRGPVES